MTLQIQEIDQDNFLIMAPLYLVECAQPQHYKQKSCWNHKMFLFFLVALLLLQKGTSEYRL